MKNVTCRGKFVWVDGKRFFQDEVLGLIDANHVFKGKRGSDLTAPLEYKESKVLTLNDVECLA